MLAADPGAASSFFTSEPGMEAQTEEERRSASQHPFVTSEGAPGHRSLCQNMNGWEMEAFQQNGTSYGSLVRHNTELLKAVKELEHTCITLREENTLLRKSSSPETEEKVKRLKRKNAELANIAKRLEERARKLQEANLRVVNSPVLAKGSNLEHYKKAFARQRAKDLSEHADIILAKDKQIEELRQECRDLHAKLGPSKEAPDRLKQSDFERVLRESQKEVLRLQRQLAVVSQREPSHQHNLGTGTELCKKRKECEGHEEEIKKRQRICEDLENELKQAWSENARLTEKTIRLSQEAQETEKIKTHNNDLRATLSVVTAERDSSLKENQRLQAKLENLEQVLKHMREVAERRHQLELEHEEALTILQAKQHEVERLQQAQFEAKKEHEGVVQLLENTLDCMQAKVRDLEEKCRSQSMQFSLLSQELEHFRLQAGNIDLLTSTLVSTEAPGLLSRGQPLLPNGVESPVAKDVESVPLPVPQPVQEEEKQEEKPEDKQDEKQEGTQEEKQEEKQEQQEEQVVCEAKGQTISVAQQSEEAETEVGSITGKVGLESTHGSSRGTPKTESARSTPKSCMTPEIDTASEAEELDIDNVSSIPEPESRVTAKLKVFIARYSYNPFDGPNENPEAELPLTAGEYIYVYGDMDEDGFYEGELMDGRRGLVPSNFIERVSDEDMLTFHPPEINELSHSSFQEISFHSGSEKSLSLRKNSIEKLETSSLHEELSLHGSQFKPDSLVSNGLVLNTEEVAEYDEDVVPYPRKLNLIKQLAKSIIVSWESPLMPGGWGTIFSYNIYVDQELRMNVKFGSPTKAVIERLDLNSKAYRIYVQSVTDKGNSDIICSSMLVGKDVCVAPTQLKVQTITATSADISWLPSNSNYTHVIFLNEEEYTVVKAGNYSYSLMNLRPNMKYKVKVEARPHQIPWELPPDRRQLKCTCTQFSTLPGGPPDAPLDIQIEASPSPGIVMISWLPVTIDAAGTSNGVRVTGYAVYVDGQKIIEVASPTAGSVLVRSSQIQLLQISKELTVRTMSPYGESADSSPVRIPRTLFTFPLHSVPLQSAPEICEHPEDSNSVRKQLSIADFRGEFDDLTGMVSDKALNCQSATSYNGKEQGGYPPAIKTPGQVVDAMPNSISVTFEEPAPVQRENTKMEENLQDGATDLRQSCEVSKFEEQPKEDVEDLENSHMKRPVGSLEEFLVNLEKEEDPDVSNTYTKEDSDENILESDPNEQMLQTTKAIEALARTIPQESDDSVSPSNTRMKSIEEFLMNSELNQEKAHIPELGEVIEQNQFQSGDIPQQGDNTANHESEDYPLDSSRGSDLSDIMEEDEEELGSDTQMNEEIQQDCSLIRDNSLKQPEQYETDSDEEFLEKILELPLQKRYSKKLFSIPEVTEDEEEEEEEEEEKKHLEVICNNSQGGTKNQQEVEKVSVHTQEKEQSEEQGQPFECGQNTSENHGETDQALKFDTKDQELEEKPTPDVSQNISKKVAEEFVGSTVQQNELKAKGLEEVSISDCISDQNNKQEPHEEQPLYTKANDKSKEWSEETSGCAYHGAEIHHIYPQEYNRSHQEEETTVEYVHANTIDESHLDVAECVEKPQPEEDDRDVSEPDVVDLTSILKMQSQTWMRSTDPREVNAARIGNQHYNRRQQVTHEHLEIDIEYGTEEDEEIVTSSLHFYPHVIHPEQMRSSFWYGSKTNRENASECSRFCESVQSHEQRQTYDKGIIFDSNASSTKSLHHHKKKNKAAFTRRLRHCERNKLQGRIAEEAWKLESYELGRTRARPEDSACSRGFTVNTDSVSHGLPDSPAIRGVHLKDSPSLKLRRGELSSSKASSVESSRSRETPILDGYNERSTKGAIDSGLVRIFVALFDYEPATMSPNPDAAEEELAFKEGQILKVFGDKDADGFYRGEANGQTGYVPCNMVSEIQVDDDGIVEQLLQRGYLAPSMSMEKLGSHMLSQPPRRTAPPPKPRRSKKVQSNKWEDTRKQERSRPGSEQQKLPMRRMVAVFDYDPRESSPNVDIEAELTFSAGDVITVYGDMDEDGFYYGDLNGLHGLAPSNFLEVIPGGETVEAAAGNITSRLSPTVAHKEKQLSSDETVAPQPMVQETDYPAVTGLCMDNQGCSENTSNNKKKKGFFSKGKKLFKRLGSSKRE
ncbi:peripheral-type benzodiazepine receptor-associated protein 1-like isoform X2 [Chiloscyllium punctatum]|uniref:peripheral-type benzodiazepine receptor-associated protein 1-like isoform X2 n=1 Tax=Chiloscyllium punctatum TaxID=137246 RepID=UPI003B63351F